MSETLKLLREKHNQVNAELQIAYKTLMALEKEQSDLERKINSFKYELSDLDTAKLYHTEEKGVQFTLGLTAPTIILGIIMGASLGLNFAVAGMFVGAFMGGAIALGINLLRVYLSPVYLEYKGAPFESSDLKAEHGHFKVLENNPQAGIYRAKFYGSLFYYSEPKLNIFVKRKNIPQNAMRIQEINLELTPLENKNKLLKEEKTKQTALKEELLKRCVELERKIKRLEILNPSPSPNTNEDVSSNSNNSNDSNLRMKLG